MLLRGARELNRNPFFRHELSRRRRRRWMAGLVVLNGVYLVLFFLARLLSSPAHGADRPRLIASFEYEPWLLGGGALLSLLAHWLIPPFLTALHTHPSRYDLRTLALMVRGRHTGEELFRGQVGAGLAPVALGAMPLVLGAPVLGLFHPDYGALAAAAILGGLLWAAMVAGISLWATARGSGLRAAALTYGLASLCIPPLVGAAAALVAWGCSAGHPNPGSVFRIAAGITAGLLVIGLAGVFWDWALGHFFPERRRPLWTEPDPVLPRE